MEQKPTISIIGAGRLGRALACLLHETGYRVAAVTTEHRETAADFSDASGIPAVFSNVEAAALGDLILLTVPDRVISSVLAELIEGRRLRGGQIILHTSGAYSGELLAPAREFGVHVGSMHPLQSFADPAAARQNLTGSAFAIDGDPIAVIAASRLALTLGGRVLNVPPQERILYHAAACFASNYLVTLMYIAESLLERWTDNKQSALEALLPLTSGSLHNVAKYGTSVALTGPIVRGDATTVARHIEALPAEYQTIYKGLGQVTLQLAGKRVPPAEKELIENLLKPGGYLS